MAKICYAHEPFEVNNKKNLHTLLKRFDYPCHESNGHSVMKRIKCNVPEMFDSCIVL